MGEEGFRERGQACEVRRRGMAWEVRGCGMAWEVRGCGMAWEVRGRGMAWEAERGACSLAATSTTSLATDLQPRMLPRGLHSPVPPLQPHTCICPSASLNISVSRPSANRSRTRPSADTSTSDANTAPVGELDARCVAASAATPPPPNSVCVFPPPDGPAAKQHALKPLSTWSARGLQACVHRRAWACMHVRWRGCA
eukprot:360774-Chlamydomonas_euryale.AAC.2